MVTHSARRPRTAAVDSCRRCFLCQETVRGMNRTASADRRPAMAKVIRWATVAVFCRFLPAAFVAAAAADRCRSTALVAGFYRFSAAGRFAYSSAYFFSVVLLMVGVRRLLLLVLVVFLLLVVLLILLLILVLLLILILLLIFVLLVLFVVVLRWRWCWRWRRLRLLFQPLDLVLHFVEVCFRAVVFRIELERLFVMRLRVIQFTERFFICRRLVRALFQGSPDVVMTFFLERLVFR